MPDLRKIIAASLLSGAGAGLNKWSDISEKKIEGDIELKKYQAQQAAEKSPLQKDYEFIENLPDSDAQDRAIKIKSAGQLLMNPSGKISKYDPSKKPKTTDLSIFGVK